MSTPDFDLVVRNAHVFTAADEMHCDIAIRAGRIVQLGQGLGPGAREIDAAGRAVTPGGVDAHCHLDQPMEPPARMADDFDTGTRSAACGGTTTVIPFAAQHRGQSLRAAVEDYRARAAGKAHVDYAFHMIVSDPTPAVLHDELPALIREGFTSFKIYMTYDDMKLDDGQILDLLDVAREEGAMAMLHAENADCIEWLTRRLEAAGRTAPRYHAHARPMLVEREATHRAIALAQLVDVPILIVHVSGREAVEQIRWARAHGLQVFAETCPQYLFLTAEDLGIDDSYKGARCVCSPPPRDAGNQQVIWDGLTDGLFTVFSSDHAPFRYDAPEGKKPGGKEVPFRHIPNGIPGLETRMPLLWSDGVLAGRMTPQRFVELTATGPARAYGLHPRKGSIAVGADADLVVWDERPVEIRNDRLHHAVDYTPYEGRMLRAWPGLTLSRGEVVWDGQDFHPRPGHGELLACGRPSLWPRRRAGH
ncbi:dihydropyrimidinase [Acidovorax sp. NCPPB 3859]|nr:MULTISPECIES: dihydropyrimidinase [unclassified Acidovorax]MDA8449495.1 dihydropyrimidinase [Acidovorax sp. GBBC 3297]MDA8458416.1 dihydropyrimidinase [Acidovorax sp. GBBC 3333]MDA8463454.1 dihydropyrimidinase [Acidovorax sp. GBBC 3332]MDA8468675.1 dihydropyrimidinase [Acidovorax sp. GBBC 3299]WCM77031.1 dihydropyrimidinase [Acidovorax sp. GBBC 712]